MACNFKCLNRLKFIYTYRSFKLNFKSNLAPMPTKTYYNKSNDIELSELMQMFTRKESLSGPEIKNLAKGLIGKNYFNNLSMRWLRIDDNTVSCFILQCCQQFDTIDLGFNYFKHLVDSREKITLSERIALFNLVQKDVKFCNENSEFLYAQICHVKSLAELMDHTTLKACVALLCNLDNHWMEAIDLIKKNKSELIQSIDEIKVIAASTAFIQNEPKLGWDLLESCKGECTMPSLIAYTKYLQNLVLNKSFSVENLNQLFEYMQKKEIHVNKKDINFYKQLQQLVNLLNSFYEKDYVWKISQAIADRETGQCVSCNKHLNDISIDSKSFNELRSAFLNDVLIGKDINIKSSHAEAKRFYKFLCTSPHFDVVLDGLNIAYKSKKNNSLDKISYLQYFINHFQSNKQKVLLLGRLHMTQWPKFKNIQKLCSVFLFDNATDDDAYIIYAAMFKGINTFICTGDFLRGKTNRFVDKKLTELFEIWQKTHQYGLFLRGSSINIVPPIKHDIFTHKIRSSNEPADPEEINWHIACAPNEFNITGYNFEASIRWICLQRLSRQNAKLEDMKNEESIGEPFFNEDDIQPSEVNNIPSDLLHQHKIIRRASRKSETSTNKKFRKTVSESHINNLLLPNVNMEKSPLIPSDNDPHNLIHSEKPSGASSKINGSSSNFFKKHSDNYIISSVLSDVSLKKSIATSDSNPKHLQFSKKSPDSSAETDIGDLDFRKSKFKCYPEKSKYNFTESVTTFSKNNTGSFNIWNRLSSSKINSSFDPQIDPNLNASDEILSKQKFVERNTFNSEKFRSLRQNHDKQKIPSYNFKEMWDRKSRDDIYGISRTSNRLAANSEAVVEKISASGVKFGFRTTNAVKNEANNQGFVSRFKKKTVKGEPCKQSSQQVQEEISENLSECDSEIKLNRSNENCNKTDVITLENDSHGEESIGSKKNLALQNYKNRIVNSETSSFFLETNVNVVEMDALREQIEGQSIKMDKDEICKTGKDVFTDSEKNLHEGIDSDTLTKTNKLISKPEKFVSSFKKSYKADNISQAVSASASDSSHKKSVSGIQSKKSINFFRNLNHQTVRSMSSFKKSYIVDSVTYNSKTPTIESNAPPPVMLVWTPDAWTSDAELNPVTFETLENATSARPTENLENEEASIDVFDDDYITNNLERILDQGRAREERINYNLKNPDPDLILEDSFWDMKHLNMKENRFYQTANEILNKTSAKINEKNLNQELLFQKFNASNEFDKENSAMEEILNQKKIENKSSGDSTLTTAISPNAFEGNRGDAEANKSYQMAGQKPLNSSENVTENSKDGIEKDTKFISENSNGKSLNDQKEENLQLLKGSFRKKKLTKLEIANLRTKFELNFLKSLIEIDKSVKAETEKRSYQNVEKDPPSEIDILRTVLKKMGAAKLKQDQKTKLNNSKSNGSLESRVAKDTSQIFNEIIAKMYMINYLEKKKLTGFRSSFKNSYINNNVDVKNNVPRSSNESGKQSIQEESRSEDLLYQTIHGAFSKQIQKLVEKELKEQELDKYELSHNSIGDLLEEEEEEQLKKMEESAKNFLSEFSKQDQKELLGEEEEQLRKMEESAKQFLYEFSKQDRKVYDQHLNEIIAGKSMENDLTGAFLNSRELYSTIQYSLAKAFKRYEEEMEWENSEENEELSNLETSEDVWNDNYQNERRLIESIKQNLIENNLDTKFLKLDRTYSALQVALAKSSERKENDIVSDNSEQTKDSDLFQNLIANASSKINVEVPLKSSGKMMEVESANDRKIYEKLIATVEKVAKCDESLNSNVLENENFKTSNQELLHNRHENLKDDKTVNENFAQKSIEKDLKTEVLNSNEIYSALEFSLTKSSERKEEKGAISENSTFGENKNPDMAVSNFSDQSPEINSKLSSSTSEKYVEELENDRIIYEQLISNGGKVTNSKENLTLNVVNQKKCKTKSQELLNTSHDLKNEETMIKNPAHESVKQDLENEVLKLNEMYSDLQLSLAKSSERNETMPGIKKPGQARHKEIYEKLISIGGKTKNSEGNVNFNYSSGTNFQSNYWESFYPHYDVSKSDDTVNESIEEKLIQSNYWESFCPDYDVSDPASGKSNNAEYFVDSNSDANSKLKGSELPEFKNGSSFESSERNGDLIIQNDRDYFDLAEDKIPKSFKSKHNRSVKIHLDLKSASKIDTNLGEKENFESRFEESDAELFTNPKTGHNLNMTSEFPESVSLEVNLDESKEEKENYVKVEAENNFLDFESGLPKKTDFLSKIPLANQGDLMKLKWELPNEKIDQILSSFSRRSFQNKESKSQIFQVPVLPANNKIFNDPSNKTEDGLSKANEIDLKFNSSKLHLETDNYEIFDSHVEKSNEENLEFPKNRKTNLSLADEKADETKFEDDLIIECYETSNSESNETFNRIFLNRIGVVNIIPFSEQNLDSGNVIDEVRYPNLEITKRNSNSSDEFQSAFQHSRTFMERYPWWRYPKFRKFEKYSQLSDENESDESNFATSTSNNKYTTVEIPDFSDFYSDEPDSSSKFTESIKHKKFNNDFEENELKDSFPSEKKIELKPVLRDFFSSLDTITSEEEEDYIRRPSVRLLKRNKIEFKPALKNFYSSLDTITSKGEEDYIRRHRFELKRNRKTHGFKKIYR